LKEPTGRQGVSGASTPGGRFPFSVEPGSQLGKQVYMATCDAKTEITFTPELTANWARRMVLITTEACIIAVRGTCGEWKRTQANLAERCLYLAVRNLGRTQSPQSPRPSDDVMLVGSSYTIQHCSPTL
jgi:hypothetical protein